MQFIVFWYPWYQKLIHFIITVHKHTCFRTKNYQLVFSENDAKPVFVVIFLCVSQRKASHEKLRRLSPLKLPVQGLVAFGQHVTLVTDHHSTQAATETWQIEAHLLFTRRAPLASGFPLGISCLSCHLMLLLSSDACLVF